MELSERIKQIRKEAKLTQEAFGSHVGVGKTAVTYYENGTREPSASVKKLICEKFNINETWLLTGDGAMHDELSPEDELAQLAADIYGMSPDSFSFRMMKKLARLAQDLSVQELEVLEKVVQMLADEE